MIREISAGLEGRQITPVDFPKTTKPTDLLGIATVYHGPGGIWVVICDDRSSRWLVAEYKSAGLTLNFWASYGKRDDLANRRASRAAAASVLES